jgi:hypothetical protein
MILENPASGARQHSFVIQKLHQGECMSRTWMSGQETGFCDDEEFDDPNMS